MPSAQLWLPVAHLLCANRCGTPPQIPADRIWYKALFPEGGASDVGASLQHYCRDNGVGLMVVGARDMGDVRRSFMALVGVGSVSDYCVHRLEVPVAVFKQELHKVK